MSGHLYGEAEPTESCPFCGETCEADFVDIGIGYQQCSPYHCEACGASQMGPNDDDKDPALSPEERKCGWFRGGRFSVDCNTINGEPIWDHRVAMGLYRAGLLDRKP